MKQRRAVVVGLDYHARFLADVLNAHSKTWTLNAYGGSRWGTLRAFFALRKADALVCFGGPAPNAALTIAAKRLNVPVIVIWAGSDVMKAQSDPFGLEVIKQEHFINLAVAPWLVDELKDLGVDASYEPVAGMEEGGAVQPLPATFRVLTYLPEPRRNFYGAQLVYDVARAMPDVDFTVVGAGGRSPEAPSNVHFCGLVKDMQDRLDNTTVLLREPEHDGKSVLVLEALARARHVVWNYDFPYVNTARSTEAVLAKLTDLKRRHDEGTLEPNYAGREYVLRNFARADIAANVQERLDRVADERALWPRQNKRRVAISGLGLFCGGVVRHARRFVPDWDARLLRTNSRLELLASLATMFGCDVWYSIGTGGSDRLMHWFARIMRKPRVIHWVGSDIAKLRKDPKLRMMLSSPDVLHLAEISWTANQLKALGLRARIAPLPPRHHTDDFTPMPERFTVMLYVPRTRADFYGRRAFERLMRQLRHKAIRYVVVGGGTIDAPPGVEVENLGWRDNMHSLYGQVSALIRYTPRDGLSLMVLEALSFGRHVLWTQPFPFVRRVRRYRDMEREICELLQAHEYGVLHPQSGASEFVQRQYGPEPCMQAISRAWEDASAANRTRNAVAAEAP